MTQEILTQEKLKSILRYDRLTGLFYWRVGFCNVCIGDIAGCVGSHGYIQIAIDKKLYLAHRLAFLYIEGCFPPDQVDHISRIKIDNRYSNLRKVTNCENHKNKGITKANKTGATGVFFVKSREKYQVTISKEYIGIYSCFDEAVNARNKAEIDKGYL